MNELAKYDVTSKDLAKGRNMKIGAVAAPVALTILPVIVFTVLFVLFAATPGSSISLIFLGALSTIIGLVIGLSVSGLLMYRHSNWTKEMRERIAADGIKAEEIGWFTKELKGTERKSLKALAAADPLLEDAFRETLASRLTATRIIKSSKRELQLAQRRQARLKYLKSENSADFQAEIKKDIDKLSSIHTEARQMQTESETRLQMIEAAAMRGTNMADSELALKKLTARTAQLPFALEAARMEDDLRRELEKEPPE
jgi:hypothetical protein